RRGPARACRQARQALRRLYGPLRQSPATSVHLSTRTLIQDGRVGRYIKQDAHEGKPLRPQKHRASRPAMPPLPETAAPAALSSPDAVRAHLRRWHVRQQAATATCATCLHVASRPPACCAPLASCRERPATPFPGWRAAAHARPGSRTIAQDCTPRRCTAGVPSVLLISSAPPS